MLKLYFVSLIVFLGIDGVWLTVVARKFYAEQLGYLMTKTPNLLAALIFYLIYILGVVVLVVAPALEKGNVMESVIKGALFGLVCYATYDLTNLATIKDWPILVTIIDLIWGTVLSATVAGVSFLIARWIS